MIIADYEEEKFLRRGTGRASRCDGGRGMER